MTATAVMSVFLPVSYTHLDVYKRQYRDSVKGEELAEIIQEKLNDYLEVERPRQAKGNTTYYLLKRSPGILNIVECGFLTNPEEAGKLLQDDYQEKVAAAVADGVEELSLIHI